MTGVLRYDRGDLKGSSTRTDEGYIRADAVVTRTGVFQYRNQDGSIRRELRHPDEVFKQDSLSTMSMIPITDGHPPARLVNSDNARELTVGHVGENINVDAPHIMASLAVTHADGVESVDLGKRSLSLGYKVDLVKEDGEYNGERYDYRQTNIRYNHLALVPRGRAGPEAQLNLDAADGVQVDHDDTERNDDMTTKTNENLRTVNVDGLEYPAAPEVIKHLERETARADQASEQLDQLKADAQKEKARADSLEEKLEQATNDEAIQAKVQNRVALERKVLDAMGEKVKADELSTKTDRELQEMVVKHFSPKAHLDEAEDTYVAARFDHIMEDLPEKRYDRAARGQAAAVNRPTGDADDGHFDEDDEKRKTMDAIKNQHKQKADRKQEYDA